MVIVFTLLAITACIGLAALFFGSLVAMLAALGSRKWKWLVAILLTLPVASTCFSARLKDEQRWLFKMLLTGWLLLIPLLLFLLLIFIDNDFQLPLQSSQSAN